MMPDETDAWITLAEALRSVVESLELQLAAVEIMEGDDE